MTAFAKRQDYRTVVASHESLVAAFERCNAPRSRRVLLWHWQSEKHSCLPDAFAAGARNALAMGHWRTALSRAALCALLAGHCAAFTFFALAGAGAAASERAPRPDAPKNRKKKHADDLGRVTANCRRTAALGHGRRSAIRSAAAGRSGNSTPRGMSDERVAKLDALEFSWKNPTELGVTRRSERRGTPSSPCEPAARARQAGTEK